MSRNNKGRRRAGKHAEIVTLAIHDFSGRLQTRTRAKTFEKEKMVMMIQQLKDRSSLSNNEIAESERNMLEREKEDMIEMVRNRGKPFNPPVNRRKPFTPSNLGRRPFSSG